MTITEFLEARITEDEEREARKFRDKPGALAGYTVTSTSEGEFGVALKGSTERPRFMSIAEYVERFCEPAPDVRILAECAAKRAIIKYHAEMVEAVEYLSAALPGNLNQEPDALWRTAPLRALAAVYKDHPDYDEDWAL
jgi:hypothetical protein